MSPATIENPTSHRKLTHAGLLEEVRRRFGDATDRWAFRCPNCDDVASIADWRQALTDHPTFRHGERIDNPGELIGQECLGQILGALDGPQDEWEGRGCDWTAYGLFRGPWEVIMGGLDGQPERSAWSFPLADGDDPATAVHFYNRDRFGEMEVKGAHVVKVFDSAAATVRLLRIPDHCACGARRGTPAAVTEVNEAGRAYDTEKWTNPCGHQDDSEHLLIRAGLRSGKN
ncbi:VVA0879 family protein [Streptomyces sp. NPDC059761]|uniref:VVA0879 family protein n=1 Tax=Streptomyces sp. NPDC059761 TaxID=3346937 RepID=UPI00364EA89A